MKKAILRVTILAIAASTIFVACKKDEKSIQTNQNTKTNTFKLADSDIGGIHNEAMAYANSYSFDTTSTSLFYQSLFNFNKDFYQANYPVHYDSVLITESLTLINKDTLLQKLSLLEGQWSLINNLSQSEVQLLSTIKSMIIANANGSLSNTGFHTQIHDLQANTPNLANTIIAQSVLQIATASTEYWIAEDNLENGPQGIAPWVATDAAGALVGGTIGALKGGTLGEIATGALISGAVASTGLVGKIAKGIRSLF